MATGENVAVTVVEPEGEAGVADDLAGVGDLSVGRASPADLGPDADCVVLVADSAGTGLERLARIRAVNPRRPVVVAIEADAPALSLPDATAPTAVVPLDGLPDGEALAGAVRETAGDADGYHEFRALVEHAPAMLAVLDAEGRYRYVSPSAERLLGYDAAELVGEVAFEHVHPADRADAVAQFAATVEDPDVQARAEYRFRDDDGEWRVMRSWGKNRLDDPSVRGVVVTTLDVTERHEREQKLERYRAMVGAVADGVYALDDDLRVRTVNDAALELTGYDRGEAIGSHMSRFISDASREKADRMREALVAGDQTSTTIELPIVRKDESTFPAEIRFSLVDPAADEYPGSAGVIRDISERKARERELERQNQRLEEFASVVSHDLKNPLNVMQGNLELARSGGDPDVDAMAQAADRMEGILEGLLRLARQGRAVGDTEPVDLAGVARGAWGTVDTAAAELDLADPPARVEADPDRLQELFENLFTNAVDHGGSAVTVTVGGLDDGFYVADDGEGVAPAVRDRAFEKGVTTDDRGTGFGLAIVKSIAEAHDWAVDLADSRAGGARIEVSAVGGPAGLD